MPIEIIILSILAFLLLLIVGCAYAMRWLDDLERDQPEWMK